MERSWSWHGSLFQLNGSVFQDKPKDVSSSMTIAYQLLNVQSSICHDPLSTDLRHVKFAHERACISLRITWVSPVQDDYGCVDPPGKIAPLSDLTSVSCSLRIWAPRNNASVRLAPVRVAPVKLALVRLAPVKLVSVRVAPVRVASFNIAELKSAPNRSVLLRSAWVRTALPRQANVRVAWATMALLRSARVRIALLRLAKGSTALINLASLSMLSCREVEIRKAP